MSSEPVIDVPLQFTGQDGVLTLKEKNLIGKIPLINNAISMQAIDWKTKGIVLKEPLQIPFLKTTGEFIFNNLHKYVPPEKRNQNTTLNDYPEANQLSIDKLKDAMELAFFLGCTDFGNSIGFVIAEKTKNWKVDQVAEVLGFGEMTEEQGNDLALVHPPLTAFQTDAHAKE